MKKIIFFNHFHRGDLFLSRTFVKDIVNKTKYQSFYIHNNEASFFKDIKLKEENEPLALKQINPYLCLLESKDSFLLNTWYNSCNQKYMVGCVIQTLYSIFSYYYEQLNLKINDEEFYIPEVNYKKYNIKYKNTSLFKKYKKIVLLCSNTPLSGQSNVNDFGDIINKVSDKNPNYVFIVTNPCNYLPKSNVISIDDILVKNDLFSISHFSTKCNYIVGRSSGPYSFSLTKENIKNKNKFVSICNCPTLVDFGLKKYCSSDKFHYINSNISEELIAKELNEIIK